MLTLNIKTDQASTGYGESERHSCRVHCQQHKACSNVDGIPMCAWEISFEDRDLWGKANKLKELIDAVHVT